MGDRRWGHSEQYRDKETESIRKNEEGKARCEILRFICIMLKEMKTKKERWGCNGQYRDKENNSAKEKMKNGKSAARVEFICNVLKTM